MSKKKDEKRRARAKEKAKAARRERGASPWEKLASADQVECWKAFDPEGVDPMENYVAFRALKGGGFAGAFFLVDYLCIGLKDTWYRMDIIPSEVVSQFRSHSTMTMVRVKTEELKKVIGAGLRWTREHDFREPRDLERCLKIVGGEIEVEDADVSAFGTEDGGLFYMGLKRDLEKRLMAETLEKFLDRNNVDWEFMDGDGREDDVFNDEEENEEDFESRAEEEGIAPEAARAVRNFFNGMRRGVHYWCHQKGKDLHPWMEDALLLRLGATMEALKKNAHDAKQIDVEARLMLEAMNTSRKERKEILEAYDELAEYMTETNLGENAGTEVPEDWIDPYQAARLTVKEMQENAEAEEILEEGTEMSRQGMLGAIRKWCFTTGRAPARMLEEAVDMMLESARHGMGVGEPQEKETQEAVLRAQEALMGMESEERRAGLMEAEEQIREFMASFGDFAELAKEMEVEEGENEKGAE